MNIQQVLPLLKNKKQLLLCPGPVNVAANVKLKSMQAEFGHRESEFELLFTNLQQKLFKVFEIRRIKNYTSVLITGSGSAANEAVLSSIVGNKHILIISNGEFGERLKDISQLHNKHTHHLRFPWSKIIDINSVDAYLIQQHIDVIALVHHETSSGMLNPIEQIGKLAKKHNCILFVDAVSSAGAEKIDLEKWNVDFCSTSASKALGSLPGLSIVLGRKQAFQDLKNIPAKTCYLDLYKYYQYSEEKRQTPNTPAIQLIVALDQALENILQKGVRATRQEIRLRANYIRNELRTLGLAFLIDEKNMSSILTTVKLPSNITFKDLKVALRNKNIIVYNGKGPFQDLYFQVANIGQITENDLSYFLSVCKYMLKNKTKNAISLNLSAMKQLASNQKLSFNHSLKVDTHKSHLSLHK